MLTKTYAVKEMYKTIQGEGFHAGRVAIFCRFTACNLWSGREQDRGEAKCRVNCDTDFVGTDGENGGRYRADQLADVAAALFGAEDHRMVVFTGGEPLLQLDQELLMHMRFQGFYSAVETNGTLKRENIPNIDWVCVSPKLSRSETIISHASELKLVYPQEDVHMHPSSFDDFPTVHHFLQPMEGDHKPPYRTDPSVLRMIRAENTKKCVEYILAHPKWKLSAQQHKDWGLK